MITLPKGISNSEVSSYTSCGMKHYYAFGLLLEPIQTSTSLKRGNIAHDCLAEYYKALQGGKSLDEAAEIGMAKLAGYLQADLSADGYSQVMLMELGRILLSYFKFARNDKWEILKVEEYYEAALTPEYKYSMRLDLLVRLMDGRYAGELCVVDHKTCYDFPSIDELRLSPQLPKYLGTLQFNGVPVKIGMLNHLRYRLKKAPMTDEELFRRDYLTPTAAEVRGVMKEQIKASNQIIELYKADDLDAWHENALRNMNAFTCKNCSFKDPCLAEVGGSDITLMLKTHYQPNTYGYAPKDDE